MVDCLLKDSIDTISLLSTKAKLISSKTFFLQIKKYGVLNSEFQRGTVTLCVGTLFLINKK